MASGLVVLIPLVVTVAVIRFLFDFTSGILLPIVDPAVATWPLGARAALSLAILIVVTYVLGAVATHVVGRRILQLGERLVLKLPFVKVIYASSKQVVAAFQGQQRKAFKSVVFVEFPRPGMRAVGFVTGRIELEDGSSWETVFVPTTPNPTTGFLQLVPAGSLVRTDYTVEEGVKMVMSLGVLTPTTNSLV
jgi:uncharacterized membrane protein